MTHSLSFIFQGIEKEERNTLHVVEKDLDEFVESMIDAPVTEKTVTRVEMVEETASSASPQGTLVCSVREHSGCTNPLFKAA